MKKPLEGVRVLDLTHFESGPSCTILLAYMGAEVIKVEPPEKGEPGRYAHRERGSNDDAWYFLMQNSNKKSITLNLRTNKGKNIFEKLAKKGDVIVSNFRHGVMERLGLSYPRLKEINPRIIYALVSAYGSSGPYAHYPSYDIIAQAMGGVMSYNGFPDRSPIRVSATIGDCSAAIHMVGGIAAALYSREQTGEGMLVEVSMQEAVVNLMRTSYQFHHYSGGPLERMGSMLVGQYPWDTFPANDGYIVIATLLEHHWKALCEVINRIDMKEELKFESMPIRYKYREEIYKAISEWTSKRNKRVIMEMMIDNGVPCGVVLDSNEILNDPHLQERGMVQEITHHQRGKFKQLGNPIRFNGEGANIEPSPVLGEHNYEIYNKMLNYTKNELTGLKNEGVI